MAILKVQVPAKGKGGLYVTVGIWREERNWIALAFPGKKVHAYVNNKAGTSRYQPHLYKILRGLLEDHGRWQESEK